MEKKNKIKQYIQENKFVTKSQLFFLSKVRVVAARRFFNTSIDTMKIYMPYISRNVLEE